MIFFRRRSVPPDIARAMAEVRTLLGLSLDATEFRVVYGTSAGDNEIALLTRSMAQILIELATQIDVPLVHVAERRAVPSMAEGAAKIEPLIRVRSGPERPADDFVSIKYRDHWYWVDDRDLWSKRTFSFLMILFSLADTGGKESLPLVTIPAG